jgi:hypothetical protein
VALWSPARVNAPSESSQRTPSGAFCHSWWAIVQELGTSASRDSRVRTTENADDQEEPPTDIDRRPGHPLPTGLPHRRWWPERD